MRKLLILLILIPCMLQAQRNYYVSNTGSDSNDGTIGSPFQTISKVNTLTLVAGDSILFNRGDTWYENLQINHSGSISAQITYGVYGTGDLPVISAMRDVTGWDVGVNWENTGGNIWRISFMDADVGVRILVDGTEKARVYPDTSYEVNADSIWSYDGTNNLLYIYAIENPSTAYTSMRASANWGTYLFNSPSGKNYITVQNIAFEGWYQAIVRSSIGWIIEGCEIGKYWSDYGLNLYATGGVLCENWIIRNNTFDSHFRLYEIKRREAHGYYNVVDGLRILYGGKNIYIYGNTFRGWRSSIEIRQTSSSIYTIENIQIYNNSFSNEGQSYGRAFAIEGLDIPTFNESLPIRIFNNVINEQVVRSQIQAPYTLLYNNIFDTASGEDSDPTKHAQLSSVNNYGGAQPYRMKYYNNVFANAGYDAFSFFCYITSANSAIENEFVNNIFYESGRRYLELVSSTRMQDNVFKNNIFYTTNDARIRFHNTHVSPAAYTFWTVAQFDALAEDDATNNPSNFITSGNIEADPLFVNPAAGDFRLQAGSPAIGAGLTTLSDYDYDGEPWKSPPSIGAYEFYTTVPPVDYTLVIEIVGGGSVEVEGVTYTTSLTFTENTEVKLEAIPMVGYTEFINWTGDLVSTNTVETITMDGHKTITANFMVMPGSIITSTGSIILHDLGLNEIILF